MAFLDRITMSSTTCFGFIPLRAGTIILLWLNLVASVLLITLSSETMILLGYEQKHLDEAASNKLKVSSVVSLVLASLGIIGSIVGLYGTQCNKRPSLLKPFIYFCVVDAAFLVFEIVDHIVEFFSKNDVQDYEKPGVIFQIFFSICVLALQWHFVSVAHQYYKLWKAEAKSNYQCGDSEVAYCPNIIA